MWWIRLRPQHPRDIRAMSTLRTDVAIVGAGIAGMSVACALADRGQTGVIILEQEDHPGYHSTGRSAAIFVEGYGTPLVQRLTDLSRPLLAGDDSAMGNVLTPRGLLYVSTKEGPATQAIDQSRSTVGISTADAQALVPLLNGDVVECAFFDPTAADIDVHAMQTAYIRGLRARSGALMTGAALTAAHWNGSVWRLAAGAHRIEARVVVNAAGAWAHAVGRLFNAQPILLEPRRRSAAIVATDCEADPSRWPMVVDMGETVYFKPEAGRLMLSPADETPSAPCDAAPDELDIAHAVDRFERLTRYKVRRVTHRWAGLRTFAADRNPVLGLDGLAPNFFWHAGQGGVGVQTAPITAQILADLILGQSDLALLDAAGLAAVSPQRFAHTPQRASHG